MPLAVADYRTNTNNMLATAIDSAKWTTGILDEGLRNALQEFTERGPTVEAAFIAVDPGYIQNIGDDYPDLYSIERLAWPYEADRTDPTDWDTPFRTKEHGIVVLETHDSPVAGDVIQVVYRRIWAISGLDSAAETTVADTYQRTITTLAAYHACVLRLRQLTENPNLLTAQTDETTTVTPSGNRTTTVTSGDRTTTVTSGDRTTTVTSGDRTTTVTSGDITVDTTANSNQFPPIPAKTVTTDNPTITTVDDVPTVTTVDDVPTVTTVDDVPTVVTVEDIPTMETGKSTIEERYINVITLTRALERSMKFFREMADERLARINHNHGSFVNPSWSRVGL